ncbi:MAG TPA: HEAT repeat domain-containing protein [Pyrinomonadaceae bacterium]|nr:HEAT repeat domain-containing protein [Pyrinomonadaceae bacterium]
MSKKLSSLLTTLLVVLAITTTAMAQQRRNLQPGHFQGQSSANRAQADAATVFRSARDMITDGEWAKAQQKFSEYVSSYPNEKNLDAALYWLAYSQQKLRNFDDCKKTINQLLEKYPESNWRDDARVLLVQVPGAYVPGAYVINTDETPKPARAPGAYVIASGQTPKPIRVPGDVDVTVAPAEPVVVYRDGVSVTVPPAAPVAIGQGVGIGVGGVANVWSVDEFESSNDDDPCEFKIVVLQALFQTDVQRGIVTASEWLKPGSTQTVRCKSAALTLLGRHGGKSVTPVILGVARSEPDLKLRARAISTLGATNDDTVIDALRDFALTSQENDIIEASLYALSKHTGDRAIAVLSDIAISGKTPGQRKVAISSISTRPGEPAVDALFKIYDADQSVEIRRAVISGFANRKSERAGNKLFEIARSSDNNDLRKSAIGAISRRGGEKAVEFLVNLYDTEKNEELRDQIVNSLASGSVFVTSSGYVGYVGQNASGGTSRLNDQRVIDKFIQIARDQQAPMERRKRVIGWLSRSKDPKVLAFLQELLK